MGPGVGVRRWNSAAPAIFQRKSSPEPPLGCVKNGLHVFSSLEFPSPSASTSSKRHPQVLSQTQGRGKFFLSKSRCGGRGRRKTSDFGGGGEQSEPLSILISIAARNSRTTTTRASESEQNSQQNAANQLNRKVRAGKSAISRNFSENKVGSM